MKEFYNHSDSANLFADNFEVGSNTVQKHSPSSLANAYTAVCWTTPNPAESGSFKLIQASLQDVMVPEMSNAELVLMPVHVQLNNQRSYIICPS